LPLLERAEADHPSAGLVRLAHFAEVAHVRYVANLETALRLQDLHCWSEQTIRARFAYRQPGLFVLAVRLYRAAQVHELAETTEYAGCKSWVELERELPTENAVPVLSDAAFEVAVQALQHVCA